MYIDDGDEITIDASFTDADPEVKVHVKEIIIDLTEDDEISVLTVAAGKELTIKIEDDPEGDKLMVFNNDTGKNLYVILEAEDANLTRGGTKANVIPIPTGETTVNVAFDGADPRVTVFVTYNTGTASTATVYSDVGDRISVKEGTVNVDVRVTDINISTGRAAIQVTNNSNVVQYIVLTSSTVKFSAKDTLDSTAVNEFYYTLSATASANTRVCYAYFDAFESIHDDISITIVSINKSIELIGIKDATDLYMEGKWPYDVPPTDEIKEEILKTEGVVDDSLAAFHEIFGLIEEEYDPLVSITRTITGIAKIVNLVPTELYTITFEHGSDLEMKTTSLGSPASIELTGHAVMTIEGKLELVASTLTEDSWIVINGVKFTATDGNVIFDLIVNNGEIAVTVVTGELLIEMGTYDVTLFDTDKWSLVGMYIAGDWPYDVPPTGDLRDAILKAKGDVNPALAAFHEIFGAIVEVYDPGVSIERTISGLAKLYDVTDDYTIIFEHGSSLVMTITNLGPNPTGTFTGEAMITVTGTLELLGSTLTEDSWLLINGVLFEATGGDIIFDLVCDGDTIDVTVDDVLSTGVLLVDGEEYDEDAEYKAADVKLKCGCTCAYCVAAGECDGTNCDKDCECTCHAKIPFNFGTIPNILEMDIFSDGDLIFNIEKPPAAATSRKADMEIVNNTDFVLYVKLTSANVSFSTTISTSATGGLTSSTRELAVLVPANGSITVYVQFTTANSDFDVFVTMGDMAVMLDNKPVNPLDPFVIMRSGSYDLLVVPSSGIPGDIGYYYSGKVVLFAGQTSIDLFDYIYKVAIVIVEVDDKDDVVTLSAPGAILSKGSADLTTKTFYVPVDDDGNFEGVITVKKKDDAKDKDKVTKIAYIDVDRLIAKNIIVADDIDDAITVKGYVGRVADGELTIKIEYTDGTFGTAVIPIKNGTFEATLPKDAEKYTFSPYVTSTIDGKVYEFTLKEDLELDKAMDRVKDEATVNMEVVTDEPLPPEYNPEVIIQDLKITYNANGTAVGSFYVINHPDTNGNATIILSGSTGWTSINFNGTNNSYVLVQPDEKGKLIEFKATYDASKFGEDNKNLTIIAKDATGQTLTTGSATFSVTYDANDENADGEAPIDDTKYEHGNKVMIIGNIDLTVSGKVFLGWSFDKDAALPEFIAGDDFKIYIDATLYAVWADVGGPYNVTYDDNGATAGVPPTDAIDYGSGDPVTVLEVIGLTKDGSAFIGWSFYPFAVTADLVKDDIFTILGDIVLYAVWEQEEFSVTYDKNGATAGAAPAGSSGHAFEDEIEVEAPAPAMIRTGYTFLGWSSDKDAAFPEFKAGDKFDIENDVTLYAVWKFDGNPLTSDEDQNMNRVSKNEFGYGFTVENDNHLSVSALLEIKDFGTYMTKKWYASIVDADNVKLSNDDGKAEVTVGGNSSSTYYLRLIWTGEEADDLNLALPLEILLDGVPLSLSEANTDVEGNMSAKGNNIYASLNSTPTIVWVLVALSVVMGMLIFWLGMRRGVFSRKR
ncbi:MAG: InlB B-repeat-containing protein [Methanomassiliicoccaceae archaeon]|nr:InlB B-repeat-containing protein [Methanomassiliicoccaceae archaeon]